MITRKSLVLRSALLALFVPVLVLAACDTDEKLSDPGCSKETACANGAGSLKSCFTRDTGGACKTLSYSVGNQTFPCVSCTDEAYCSNAAAIACGIPGSSIPAGAEIPDGAPVPGVDAGASDAAATDQ